MYCARFRKEPPAQWPRLSRAGCAVSTVVLVLLSGCSDEPASKPATPVSLAEGLEALRQPNIVMFLCDMLRADLTTPYGGPDTTPELARWAERGVVFERVRSQSSWTKVSMASTLTSLWPRSHGIETSTDGLSERATTLAEALQKGGYRTFGVQTNGWLEQSFGFQQGFESYLFPTARGAVGLDRSQVWTHGGRVRDEFRRVLEVQSPEEPFFIYLHFMDVHEYSAPPEYQQFGTDTTGAYKAAIRWTDAIVQDVRELVQKAGYGGSTLLIFGSDHGEFLGENQRYGHAKDVLTPVVTVPLLFRFPFPVEPVHVPSQVRNIDIAPTLLDIAGVPIPESFEGESLVPLMLSPESHADRLSFASLHDRLFRDAVLQDAVTDGRWTYVRNLTDTGEPDGEMLFDREVDPGETVNLASRKPEQTARLRRTLEQHLETKPEEKVVEKRVRINPNIANKLHALGYLQNTPIDDAGDAEAASQSPSEAPGGPAS